MKSKLTVVKLGGNAIDDVEQMQVFLAQFVGLPGAKILVHGGGKMASTLCDQLGLPTQMINGRRVTDHATLQVATMVYAGLINKNIVAQLQARGCNALGLCGADGNLIRAEKRSPLPVDYGFAGDPVEVNAQVLTSLLDNHFVPVLAPVTHDANAQLLNTNADTIASIVAAAMSAVYDVHLVFAFEKNGVLADHTDHKSVIHELSKSAWHSMVNSGSIHSGMLPKLSAGFRALENNVRNVTVTHLGALQSPQATSLVL